MSSEKSREQAWLPAKKNDLRPGEVIYVHTSAGGYDDERGFIGSEGTAPVSEVLRKERKHISDECNETGGDALSTLGQAITITQHGCETAEEMRSLLASLSDMFLYELRTPLETAALWHDVGKAHEIFQTTMRRDSSLTGNEFWAKSARFLGKHDRRYFRHELVSALAFLEGCSDRPEADLIAYLIAAHHGKARVTVAPIPGEQDETRMGVSQILGVRKGDKVPAVAFCGTEASPAFETSLAMFNVGSEDERLTWVDRSTRLRDERGPFVLAYLELLVRLADWRASARHANSRQAVTA
jgi:CRISPR-associated endonuclease/helicase Cas3